MLDTVSILSHALCALLAGNVIGHGQIEAYTSESDSFVSVSDGKGGRMKIRKQRGSVAKGHWKGETPVFSDATTDSDIVAERLKNMTEEEKAAYLAEREKRKQDREAKRREKYGDKYDEMMEQHERSVFRKKMSKTSNVSFSAAVLMERPLLSV